MVTIVGMSNKGDSAILKTMINSISKSYSSPNFTFLSPSPGVDKQFFSTFGNVFQGELFLGVDEKSKFFRITYVTLRIFQYLLWSKFNFIPIDRRAKRIFQCYRDADLIIYAGGGYLGGPYHSIYNTLIPMYLAKKLGAKIYLSGITVEEPQGFLLKKIMKSILNKIDLITVREPESLKVLEKMKIKSKFILTSDHAFLLGCESSTVGRNLLNEVGIINNNKLRIGINLKDWNSKFTNNNLSEVSINKIVPYQKAMVETIEKLLTKLDAEIVLFPFQTTSNNNDLKLSLKIKENVKPQLQNKIFVLKNDYSPEQLKTMIGEMDIFIGTRFHSTVFALSMGVPTISISYMQKNHGLMNMMDLEDWSLDFDTLNSEHIVEKTLKLLSQRKKIIEKIKNEIPQLKKNASQNTQFISKLI